MLVLHYVDVTEGQIQDMYKPHETDAGFDVRSNEDFLLSPGARKLVSTGLFLDIPKGYEVQVRPRSGLAIKHGVTVLNTPGTIDEHYTDECKVILINLGDTDFTVNRGDRIAQFILAPVVAQYQNMRVSKIDKESRGGGFGHSGK